MAKLQTKWISDDAVNQEKFKSDNDAYVRARNAADNGDVDVYKVNATDQIEFNSIPVMPSTAPATDGAVANKKYVDDQIAALPAVPAVFEVQGNWDAATNTPTLVSSTGTANHLYIVNVAGSTALDGISEWSAGDWVYFANGVWNRADNVDAINSVNGQTGIVSLDSDDISEGSTNFYYTEGRFDTSFAGKSTTDLSEGTNEYFTQARARAAAVDDTAYDQASWDGVVDQAPSKNAVRDEIVALRAEIAAATGSQQGREVITLNGTDISNGYIELAQPALANSLMVNAVGGLAQEPGVDFTESIVVTNTRVTFAGDLASTLASGDKLLLQYEYQEISNG